MQALPTVTVQSALNAERDDIPPVRTLPWSWLSVDFDQLEM